jgi:hypothetical protein
VSCSSKAGDRTECPADTSAGVVLVRSSGTAACLLGKTWGYDQTSIWVSDGCSGDFATRQATPQAPAKAPPPRHIPNIGFLVFDGEKAEYYRRWLSHYGGVKTAAIPDITDNGYQVQASAMPIRGILQGYVSWSQVFGGAYGNDWEVRGGENWFPMKQRGIRINGEVLYVNRSPVGYTAYPYPVGAKGPVFHLNFELNF